MLQVAAQLDSGGGKLYSQPDLVLHSPTDTNAAAVLLSLAVAHSVCTPQALPLLTFYNGTLAGPVSGGLAVHAPAWVTMDPQHALMFMCMLTTVAALLALVVVGTEVASSSVTGAAVVAVGAVVALVAVVAVGAVVATVTGEGLATVTGDGLATTTGASAGRQKLNTCAGL